MNLLTTFNIICIFLKSINADPAALLSGVTTLAGGGKTANAVSTPVVGLSSDVENGRATVESAGNRNTLLSGGTDGVGNILDVGKITKNTALVSSLGGIASATAKATSILDANSVSPSDFFTSIDSSATSISKSLESLQSSYLEIGNFVQSAQTSIDNVSENATTLSELIRSNPVIVYNDDIDFEDFQSSLSLLYDNSEEYLGFIDNTNEILIALKSVHVAIVDFVLSVVIVTAVSTEVSTILATWNTGIENITDSIKTFVLTLDTYLTNYENLDDHIAITIHNVYLLTLSASLDVISEFGDYLEVFIRVSNGETINLNEAIVIYLQKIVKHINYLNRNESKIFKDSSSSLYDISNVIGSYNKINNQYLKNISTATNILDSYTETLAVLTSSFNQFSQALDTLSPAVSTFDGIIALPESVTEIQSSYSEVASTISSIASKFSEISDVYRDNTKIIEKIETHSDEITSAFESIYESYDITNYVTVIDNLDSLSNVGASLSDDGVALREYILQGYSLASSNIKYFQTVTNSLVSVTKTTTQISSVFSNFNSIDSLSNLPTLVSQLSDMGTLTEETRNNIQIINSNVLKLGDLVDAANNTIASTESSLSFVTDNLEKGQLKLSAQQIAANISAASTTLNILSETQKASDLSNHITFISLASTTNLFVSELGDILQENEV